MTSTLCRQGTPSGNPVPSLVHTYQPPSSSPDSERLDGPVWTASGLTIHAPCRLYMGNGWAAAIIVATGLSDALLRTRYGLRRCTDRRNILNADEATAFSKARARFKRERAAAAMLESGS